MKSFVLEHALTAAKAWPELNLTRYFVNKETVGRNSKFENDETVIQWRYFVNEETVSQITSTVNSHIWISITLHE